MVLPVVVDIRGVTCWQKQVHKEAGRCTVRGVGGAHTKKGVGLSQTPGFNWNTSKPLKMVGFGASSCTTFPQVLINN